MKIVWREMWEIIDGPVYKSVSEDWRKKAKWNRDGGDYISAPVHDLFCSKNDF